MKRLLSLTIILVSVSFITSCSSNSKGEKTDKMEKVASKGVIHITAHDFKFSGPDSIPSGWVTINFTNQGKETHFFLFNKIPDEISYQEYLNGLQPPFDNVWKALKDSGITKSEAINRLVAGLPKWYGNVKQMGGAGFIDPGKSSTITLKLIPGNYEMECYMKTSSGVFHYALGMVKQITVTNDSTNITPPKADIDITLTNHNIENSGAITPGKHIVAVNFQEQPETGMGNDVHLVQIDDTTDINKVISYMDWLNIDGLQAPAPAHFLGGMHEMPAGNTAYFTVNLKKGRYAWISESYAQQGMMKEFEVD